jgi:hypothetical protein
MDIVPALTGIRLAIGLATDAFAARDDTKVKAALAELSQKLADANMGALDMSEHLRKVDAQLREAEAKLRAAEERLSQREKYILRAVAPGVFVRAYEPVDGDSTPAHYQCQICFDAGQQSVLSTSQNGNVLQCRVDGKHSVRIANNIVGVSTRGHVGWEG